jgi:molybdenum cofactor synthesis domain-containing protein
VLKIAVITVSDRAFNGEYPDRSGPEIKRIIESQLEDTRVTLTVVPDEKKLLKEKILSLMGVDYIITTGGTGISPRDVTPEVTREICDTELPGISEMLRRESYQETPFAVLSRGTSGIRENTIIVNFPGSLKAVQLCTRLMVPILEHGQAMIRGGKHG